MAQQWMSVAGVLLLAGAFAWWARRGRGAGAWRWLPAPRRAAGGPRLEAVDRLALGPAHALHLVRAGGRLLVVGLSPHGCRLLTAVDWEIPEEGGRP